MAINDVTEAFGDWLENLTGTRQTGAYVNGRWVADPDADLNFRGVVQNATPQDLLVLEEGQRTTEAIKIHTTFELVAQISDDTQGDIINYKSAKWQVYNVAHRYIGNYHKAIAIKREG